ncbi:DUF6233 domain-containing protein [Streptomyces sp. Ju416(a)]|uniref:DUF6233 domain-containing protein n=1 Tax=Streptomyces sp. Ju416(a) TaxID=3446591 RepID=UPI00403D80BB
MTGTRARSIRAEPGCVPSTGVLLRRRVSRSSDPSRWWPGYGLLPPDLTTWPRGGPGVSRRRLTPGAAEVHRGDCWAQGLALRPVSAERARAELAGGMRACAVCRPDTVLNWP